MTNDKSIYYIMAVVVVIVLIAVFMMMRPAEEPEPEITEPEPEITEPEVTLPESEIPPAPIETMKGKLEMITEARCFDNRIEVVLTNPTDETLTLAKDAKVILNGLVVVDPECDKLEIAPKESVYCSDISGHYAIRQGEVNRIQVNMKSERGLSDVDCSGQ